ncbi:MAG: hypothetical protein ACI85Q_000692 [Salibacteraceae bacterium]|jgi:hypothetical protein
MIETLLQFFAKTKEETKGKTPEGICPNCWGEQEYNNQIREMYADKQIEVNNREANYSFIQEFVVTHIEGIKLKKGNNSFECPTCKMKY